MHSFSIHRHNCIIDLKKERLDPIDIPQYEGLTIKDMLTFGGAYPEVIKYFPDGNDIYKLPKKWIADIAHTIIGDPFG